MLINKEFLKELKPCTERYKNFLEHYADFSGTMVEFLDLDKITYKDKIWVIKLVVKREILEQWAILCAESVLYIFEKECPNDKRPRDCIEYLKTGEKNKEKTLLHSRAVHAAAYTANAAAYAAYAATYAAAYAADAAAYAAYAAYAASSINTDPDTARETQQNKNIDFLKQLVKGE